MSEVPTLQLCPEPPTPPKHYQGPHPIAPEEALRRLQAELELVVDHLAAFPINGDTATNQIKNIIWLLTGRSREYREMQKLRMKKAKPKKPRICEPRDTISMEVSPATYRRQLLRKGGCRCPYCDCKLNIDNSTIDHVLPKSKGGDNSPANMILACERCNQIKSNRTPEQWAADILAVVE
ncbi:MAG TPA: hypothetical protein DD473_04650 [Planctomycetaceae bacterium]|nr:hypothetical protein [Planctomycetaceae bacterium]|tara:strand:+ start:202 stop:741 length:540 start_codon:yes stop_codon:yes gene_type:complete